MIKAFILSSYYKTFSFCFKTCTTQPLMDVSLIYISFLTSQWVLYKKRFVLPVLLGLLKFLCFGCFINTSCLLRRSVCVIFFILVMFNSCVTLFTYIMSVVLSCTRTSCSMQSVVVGRQIISCYFVAQFKLYHLVSENIKSANISFRMMHSITY